MTINDANKLVKKLVGEDDFHDVEDILSSYYNLAQRQISTTVCPIIKSMTLPCGVTVRLPDDFYRLSRINSTYTRPDRTHILVDGTGECDIKYLAYPKPLYDDSDITTEFEIDPEAQSAIPYYAAAQTVLSDSDMRRYYAFMDMYNSILTNIQGSRSEHGILTVVKPEEM